MSLKAYRLLQEVDTVVGYSTYVDLVTEILAPEQETISTGMGTEVKRCKKAIKLAQQGLEVALVSSGDSGVYGMAGLVLELVEKEASDISVEIIPGITAANAAAASLGAPLMHDYTVISLSDLLTPWAVIKKRLIKAAEGDFITALYNPKSKQRVKQIEEARQIFLQQRSAETPVGIVRSAKRGAEEIEITTLEQMLEFEINMLTTVIIGNSDTYSAQDLMITPRGYQV
ncbi:precorrin-3B C(17)-methyltransferase [Halanaerobacter jeridensis]|uniref:Precorrin-3B C17-methyltransferase n=1 Tax=Halanaerobacter jeridensis TaxID=706427 RepID=A0A939BMQ2_9FIRM|nr:precorrin-3B C(17)-methyltransferase [Halanaerobacter jeridensis]MBM7557120.1 precorrin-3B C17-methyltransferase [Halanaerobacter jeridensis]